MLPAARQEAILQLLHREGRVEATALAAAFTTSEDSIRRDLRDLAEAGRLRRVHGGAVPMAPGARASLAQREAVAPAAKQRIARAVARLVPRHQTVIIDGGSTGEAVAQALPADIACTFVTPAPRIASLLGRLEQSEVILLGGRYDAAMGVVKGATTVRELARLQADLCVLGACGFDLEAGVTAFDAEEAEGKRLMLERSGTRLLALTAAKLGTVGPYLVGPADEVDQIVLEDGVEPGLLAGIRAACPDVTCAEGEPS